MDILKKRETQQDAEIKTPSAGTLAWFSLIPRRQQVTWNRPSH